MSYTGIVKSGVVVLDKASELTDGTRVRVQPVVKRNGRKPALVTQKAAMKPSSGEPWATLLKHAGKAKGLPADFAEQHDHYIHGTPKK